ncbi:hypothetical protein EV360DRAFT_89603 [Lentinula raphanica]|nr:hypothetical protein EV360DRAFT_89603 [Lentinula raphanica]
MSTLKRKNDAFYLESTSSKRTTPSTGAGRRNPLGTLANRHTSLPSTPSSLSKMKKEYTSAMEKEMERSKRNEEEDEEDEPESQLPASEREKNRWALQKEYEELELACKKQVLEIKTLQSEVGVTRAQLASSQEQLQLLGETHQELMNDFQVKQQKSNQTERRLRAERDQCKDHLALVQAERDTAILGCAAAQRATSQAEEELQEYQKLFTLHAKLLAKAQAGTLAQ